MASSTKWVVRQYHWLLPRRGSPARRWDRIEAVVVLALLVLALLAIPAAVFAGASYHERQAEVAAAQLAEREPAAAVLLAPTPPDAVADGPSATESVPARWSVQGAERTGIVRAEAGLPAGAVVPIWLDRGGDVVNPPMRADTVTGLAVGFGVLCYAAVIAVLLLVYWAVRAVLDRLRSAEWTREWEALDGIPHPRGDSR